MVVLLPLEPTAVRERPILSLVQVEEPFAFSPDSWVWENGHLAQEYQGPQGPRESWAIASIFTRPVTGLGLSTHYEFENRATWNSTLGLDCLSAFRRIA